MTKSEVVKGMILALIIIGIVVGIGACCYNSQSMRRSIKDIKSDLGDGLDRTVTVYTADGDVLKTYKGKIDVASNDSGVVKFDLNGQRIMYYNCYVEVIENVKETEQ